MSNKFFVPDMFRDKWEKACQKNYTYDEELKVTFVDNGIVLPLRLRNDIITQDGCFEGGVCNNDLEFVAGIVRRDDEKDTNVACTRGYQIDKSTLIFRDEKVVFGGILRAHFGDFLTNSCSRLWWFVENQNCAYRFIFLTLPTEKGFVTEFFELLGIGTERYEIITVPTLFTEVIVPDEACHILSKAHKKWLLPFKKVVENVKKVNISVLNDKIYLSKCHFNKYGVGDGINEEYYEEFYRQRGYEIIYPEELTLAQQVAYIANAREIVATFGTMTHLVLFARESVNLTCLLRVPEVWNAQFVINDVNNVNCFWVLSTMNPLATSHDYGVFLYYPTVSFKEYLKYRNIDNEVVLDNPPRELLWRYIELWTNHFSSPEYFWVLKDKNAYEMLFYLNRALFNKEIDYKLFVSSRLRVENEKLKGELRKTKKDIKILQKKLDSTREKLDSTREKLDSTREKLDSTREKLDSTRGKLDEIKNSKSWKLTSPLRYIMRILKFK